MIEAGGLIGYLPPHIYGAAAESSSSPGIASQTSLAVAPTGIGHFGSNDADALDGAAAREGAPHGGYLRLSGRGDLDVSAYGGFPSGAGVRGCGCHSCNPCPELPDGHP